MNHADTITQKRQEDAEQAWREWSSQNSMGYNLVSQNPNFRSAFLAGYMMGRSDGKRGE